MTFGLYIYYFARHLVRAHILSFRAPFFDFSRQSRAQRSVSRDCFEVSHPLLTSFSSNVPGVIKRRLWATRYVRIWRGWYKARYRMCKILDGHTARRHLSNIGVDPDSNLPVHPYTRKYCCPNLAMRRVQLAWCLPQSTLTCFLFDNHIGTTTPHVHRNPNSVM